SQGARSRRALPSLAPAREKRLRAPAGPVSACSMANARSALEGAVIAFDLDGTLVDTAPDLIGTLNVLLDQEGLPPLPLLESRPFIGRGAKWLIERGFEAAGATLEEARAPELFDRFITHYLDHIADESRPFPGVEAALDELKANGARLAVCTNKR